MIDPITAIGVGSAAIGGISRLVGGRRKRPDYSRAIAELRAARPTGYLTGEDYTAAERTRGRLSEGVQRQGQLQGYEVSRRARARGLAGSPSEERSQARLNQEVLLGQQHAGETAEEQLYNIRTGREHFEREKAMAIFGAQVNEQAREGARHDAEQAAFWNSLNEFLPTIAGFTGGGGPTDYMGSRSDWRYPIGGFSP